ncbi:TetR/AcrR family transcriptional regulator [Streptomyces vinaceus]|uniref:TetR/AcrR family transcriptional regulator n=1 Tax=Streptomyces vinaceus TaxID=1960 RepID=UPI00381729D6
MPDAPNRITFTAWSPCAVRTGTAPTAAATSASRQEAAVSYHFGSLKGLCDTTIEQALERYLDAQIDALDSLGPTPTLTVLAEAFARPMMRAPAAGGRELAVMRAVARVGMDPPEDWDRLTGKFEQIRRDAARALAAQLPDVGKEELAFRARCAAGMLNWLVLSPIDAELAAQPAAEGRATAGSRRGGSVPRVPQPGLTWPNASRTSG